MALQLGVGISLPLDAITQTFGILSVRGAGKSNLAAVMAEEMHRAGLPFVVVDPVGSWWGLRSSADGKSAGLEIPIFGGRHGDIPLEKTGGQVLADLVVDERASCVLDISEFSEGDKIHFLIDFAERLYRRNTEPLHLFLEEADDYCPQRPFREQARLLRAWENVVRRGRARGLGITMITQRSASLNKSVLTQIETLFVLRTTSPQDRKAIEAWVDYHGQSREIVNSLPTLAPGEAWVWSPSWLKLTKRVQIRRRATFDSGATPKNVRGTRPAATLADVDLGKVRERMAATIERAKAEDPRALRARIVALERELATKPVAATEQIEVPVFSDTELQALKNLGTSFTAAEIVLNEIKRKVEGALRQGRPTFATATAPLPVTRPSPRVEKPAQRRTNGAVHSDEKLAGGERRILTALAQYPGGRTKNQAAILTGYAVNGGGFGNYLSALRTRGMLEGPGNNLRITDAGAAALGDFEPLPHGQDLLDHWMRQLGRAEKLALEALVRAYPRAVSKEDLAAATGYAADGGGFGNALSRLRTLELIEGRGELRASEDLFG